MRIVCLIALLCFPAAATAEELRFDVELRGVRAAQMVLNGEAAGDAYAVAGRVQGTGLVGTIVEIAYGGEARGGVAGGRLRTRNATLRDGMGDERGTTEMAWRGGAPRVIAAPDRPREAHDIDPAGQRGAVDPLTALYDMLRSQPEAGLCDWSVPMFDGRRASRLTLGPPRAVEGGLRCDAEYRRVAGFEPEDMAERTRFAFSVTYAPDGDAMRAVSMRAATKYGDAVLRRR